MLYKNFIIICTSWENVVDYKYTWNSESILSILRLLKRGFIRVHINGSPGGGLENGLISGLWFLPLCYDCLGCGRECLEFKVLPNTLNALLCSQPAACVLNYSESSCLSISSCGSVLCRGWCKTGRSAWNYNSESSRLVSQIEKCIQLNIHYLLFPDRWCIDFPASPLYLGDSLSFLSIRYFDMKV